MEQPLYLTLAILELRAYAHAKAAVDAAQSEEQMPRGAMVDMVLEVQEELLLRLRAERAERARAKSPP